VLWELFNLGNLRSWYQGHLKQWLTVKLVCRGDSFLMDVYWNLRPRLGTSFKNIRKGLEASLRSWGKIRTTQSSWISYAGKRRRSFEFFKRKHVFLCLRLKWKIRITFRTKDLSRDANHFRYSRVSVNSLSARHA